MKKWLVGLACVGMWAATAMGQLIISQYTETDSGTVPKGIEIWNPTASDITFDSSSNLLDVKVGANGATPSSVATVNSGTLVAGDVWVIGTSGMSPDTEEPFTFNGDDSIVLELGGVVQDVFGTPGTDPGSSWTNNGVSTANQNIQLKVGITNGETTGWTDPSVRFEYVSAGSTLTGFGVPPGGALPFSVTFSKTNGFVVLQGTATNVITATATNGTEPYSYAWTSTLGTSDYSAVNNEFTILATAPLGSNSATVVASDSAAKSVTNTVYFNVVTPYSITVTPPTNGTVATTPATEALAGTTVTINATPAEGYRILSTTVLDAGANPVSLLGYTFVMPTSAVTVTVLFDVYEPSDAMATFETATLPGSYTPTNALLEDGKVWSVVRVVRGNTGGSDRMIGTNSARLYPVTGTNAVLQQTEAYAEAITKLRFWVGSYGSDSMANAVLTAEVSANGTDWNVVETLSGTSNITSTLTEHIVTNLPAGAVYVRFVATAAATSGKRINVDDIGVWFGTPSPTLSYTGSSTGTVGQAMSLVFTLHNATASGWEYTLRNEDRSQVITNGSSYTFNWTPPSAGTFRLTMSALDPTNGVLATTEVSLTVNGSVEPPPIAPIVVVPGGGGDFTFTVPDGYTLVRVEGALPSQLTANTWTTLVLNTDYTVTGTTVRILTSANAGRMVRIVLMP